MHVCKHVESSVNYDLESYTVFKTENMGIDVTKPDFGVSGKARLKPSPSYNN